MSEQKTGSAAEPQLDCRVGRSTFALVRVVCPSCGWTGRRKEREAHWWRNREAPTCPKCAYHPVLYVPPNAEYRGGRFTAATSDRT